MLRLDRQTKRILETIRQREEPADGRKLEQLGIRKVQLYLVQNIITLAGGVSCDVLRPQDRSTLTRREVR